MTPNRDHLLAAYKPDPTPRQRTPGERLWTLTNGKLEQEYENKSMSNHMNNCVLWKGHLYGFDGRQDWSPPDVGFA